MRIMPARYLLGVSSVIGTTLNALHFLTFMILKAILRGRDYIISIALLRRKLKRTDVKQLAPNKYRKIEN